ncbi:ATP-binding protein [Shinella zoogloeoides]|uniref:ATP-binding protein n=1 Tax=Shinella zoogloeoides TaxID=352475 RepID=UPI00273D6A7D|nr:ATP-binding protein [Shinella zoogloeoides]WLR90902.1 ATP-binding protein [Shinella zoogloeoides]
MEVSQIAGLDTHAIIGGGKAQAFTMSESAEFFTVLSDTLYRDKKRAVIREVFCNAWDAHIVTGQKDRPVEVTLTDTELVIKDYGPGIPADKVGPIYCRYGASTKVKDENQTGGFGLGSKAPFAYSDHFSVTSCVDGFKHVYAISRGGAETDGKPDFRQMVKVPTTESGVTVSIPLKDPKDKDVFMIILKSVVIQGGMKAIINGGTPIEGHDYSKSTRGFALIGSHDLRESNVYCLYGTVLYPVQTTDQELMEAVSRVSEITAHVGRLVLIAPPNSVGVTPSRESLSYTDRTKETLMGLLARADRMIRNGMAPYAKQMTFEAAAKICKKEDELPWNRQITSTDLNRYTTLLTSSAWLTLEDIHKACAAVHISSLVKNQFKMWRLAFAAVNRDYRSHFRRAAYTPPPTRRYYGHEMPRINGFRIEARLYQRIANKLGLHENLFAFLVDGGSNSANIRPTRMDKTIKDHAKLASKKLYISFNQRDAVAQISKDRGATTYVPYDQCIAHMVFVLKRSQHAQIDKIKALAKKYGFEPVEVKVTPPPKRAPKVVKTPMYHSLMDLNDGKLPKTESLESAKYYVRGSNDWRDHRSAGHFQTFRDVLVKHYGDIAVVFDAKDEARIKAKCGAEPLLDVLVRFLKENEDKRDVQYAWAARKGFVSGSGYAEVSQLVENLSARSLEMAMHFFPAKVKMTDIGRKAYELIHVVRNVRDNGGGTKAQREQRDWIKSQVADLAKKAQKEFGHLCLDRRAVNEKFAAFKSLAGVHYYMDYSDEERVEDLFAVMRFVERRHKARIKVRSSEDAAQVAETQGADVVNMPAAEESKPQSTALTIIPVVLPPAVIIEKEAA